MIAFAPAVPGAEEFPLWRIGCRVRLVRLMQTCSTFVELDNISRLLTVMVSISKFV